MSQYTTGELARLCGVSVRTVQYYDSRRILMPSQLSGGGRRLYSAQDLDKLKVICFLRSLDLPIDTIKSLLEEDHPEQVIALLLEQQQAALREEITEKQRRVDTIADTRRALQHMGQLSGTTIGDIARVMQNNRELKKLRWQLLSMALPMNVVEMTTILLWVKTGAWQPFAIAMALVAIWGVWISRRYFTSVSYLCPQCHSVFRPAFRCAFTAKHTPYTRKLTCPHCQYKGYCV